MIQCPICQMNNEDNLRFCNECGARLGPAPSAVNQQAPQPASQKLHSPILGQSPEGHSGAAESSELDRLRKIGARPDVPQTDGLPRNPYDPRLNPDHHLETAAAAAAPPQDKPVKKLRSPLLAAEEFDDDEEPPPGPISARARSNAAPSGKQQHLHSPLLGDAVHHESGQQAMTPMGTGQTLHSPLLGDAVGHGHSGAHPGPQSAQGSGSHLHSPLLGDAAHHPQSGAHAPQSAGSGRHHLHSPLLDTGDDEDDYYEESAPRSGGLHSPMLGGGGSRSGGLRSPILGGGSGQVFQSDDYYEDEDPYADEDNPNLLRSPLLSAKMPLDHEPRQRPQAPSSGTAGQSAAQRGQAQPGYGQGQPHPQAHQAQQVPQQQQQAPTSQAYPSKAVQSPQTALPAQPASPPQATQPDPPVYPPFPGSNLAPGQQYQSQPEQHSGFQSQPHPGQHSVLQSGPAHSMPVQPQAVSPQALPPVQPQAPQSQAAFAQQQAEQNQHLLPGTLPMPGSQAELDSRLPLADGPGAAPASGGPAFRPVQRNQQSAPGSQVQLSEMTAGSAETGSPAPSAAAAAAVDGAGPEEFPDMTRFRRSEHSEQEATPILPVSLPTSVGIPDPGSFISPDFIAPAKEVSGAAAFQKEAAEAPASPAYDAPKAESARADLSNKRSESAPFVPPLSSAAPKDEAAVQAKAPKRSSSKLFGEDFEDDPAYEPESEKSYQSHSYKSQAYQAAQPASPLPKLLAVIALIMALVKIPNLLVYLPAIANPQYTWQVVDMLGTMLALLALGLAVLMSKN